MFSPKEVKKKAECLAVTKLVQMSWVAVATEAAHRHGLPGTKRLILESNMLQSKVRAVYTPTSSSEVTEDIKYQQQMSESNS